NVKWGNGSRSVKKVTGTIQFLGSELVFRSLFRVLLEEKEKACRDSFFLQSLPFISLPTYLRRFSLMTPNL
ncbi:MAG: hypothetical protein O7C62_02930, partial [Rickettsia endosymbiont of Ixodes persulcatus]|nr:hypothetical protein [Rickettsia endosymbiont of Ixodes persulcatus]